MRVPEISLGNGLHAQNKHDLCRTISIQNDIDKLNTFQLTQFHLWWCQVCRAWEFSNEKEKTDYIYLLQKEKFLIDNVQDILQNKALKLYQKCISKPEASLAVRCCDFKMLEEKCRSYSKK